MPANDSGLKEHVQRFQLKMLLGAGSFGSVYAASDRTKKDLVAIKMSTGNTSSAESIIHEARMLQRLRHPYLVRAVGLSLPLPTRPCLVLEFLPFDTLWERYQARAASREDALRVTSQAAEGLDFLHSHGVWHRDFKPNNVLVACLSPLAIRIADLGTATDFLPSETATLTSGFYASANAFVAPELFSLTHAFTADSKPACYCEKVDVWSLGVTVLWCAKKISLTYFDNLVSRRGKKPAGKAFLEWARYCSRMSESAGDRWGILQGVLSVEAAKRPGASQVSAWAKQQLEDIGS